MKSIILILGVMGLNFLAASQTLQKTYACVMVNGVIESVEADYDPRTGETTMLIGGIRKKIKDIYPEKENDYGGKAAWFINNEKIMIDEILWEKLREPEVLNGGMKKIGSYKGVGIYADYLNNEDPMPIFIPVRGGCIFQAYIPSLPPCISLKITTSPKFPKEGDDIVFTVNTSGTSEELTYSWMSLSGNVIGKMNAKTFTLSTKGMTGSVVVYVSVHVPRKDCKQANEMVRVQLMK